MSYSAVTLSYLLTLVILSIFFIRFIYHFFSKKRRRLNILNDALYRQCYEFLEEYSLVKNRLGEIKKLYPELDTRQIELEAKRKKVTFLISEVDWAEFILQMEYPGYFDRLISEIEPELSDPGSRGTALFNELSRLTSERIGLEQKLKKIDNQLNLLKKQVPELEREEVELKHRRSELECRISELKFGQQGIDTSLLEVTKLFK